MVWDLTVQHVGEPVVVVAEGAVSIELLDC